MNERKLVQNFKSYINVSPKNNGEKNGSMQELKPRLLKNELIVGEAHNVVMLRTLSEGGDSGRYGSLFITNYRLSFVPLEPEPQDEWGQRNTILGAYDVPLGTVGTIWLTDGGPVRRRRLQPIGDIQGKVKGLQVVCKNMKVLTFSMLSCAMGKGRSVAMALLHHAYPKRHDLLFAFECKEPSYTAPSPNINMFLRPSDWKRELERCACAHWRMTCVNGTSDAFMHSAGETLIVPGSVLDFSLMETARHFRSGSIPVWVWGRASGAALLRCGELLPTEHSATAESVYLEQVRKSHPKLTPPHVIYPCGNSYTGGGGPNTLPSLSSLQNSYKRLVDLCTPATLSAFWLADSQYYALLDNSRWPRSVSCCLTLADEAAARLEDNCTVLLQEGDGVDYAAVVSSLTQLLVDPYFRSIDGFQSLVQKEWVALGHPFCDRFGLPRPGTPNKDQPRSTTERAPVFLLFIECVWQLTRQFPQEFEFTDTYLTTLWDAAHNHLFDTFIFNCPRDRDLQFAKDYIQRPVWDWSKQFSEQDIALFYNPLYNLDKTTLQSPPPSRMSTLTQPTPVFPRLKPSTGLSSIEMWSQCYERWLTPLQGGAGNYHYYVYNNTLIKQIKQLKERLATLAIMDESVTLRPIELLPPIHVDVPRFYPFCQNTTYAPQASLHLMQTGAIDASRLLDSQSLLNAPD